MLRKGGATVRNAKTNGDGSTQAPYLNQRENIRPLGGSSSIRESPVLLGLPSLGVRVCWFRANQLNELSFTVA